MNGITNFNIRYHITSLGGIKLGEDRWYEEDTNRSAILVDEQSTFTEEGLFFSIPGEIIMFFANKERRTKNTSIRLEL